MNIRVMGKPGIVARLLAFATLLTALSTPAPGHSDPWGDIHPQVEVVDGNFAITFNTSREDEAFDHTDQKKVSRVTYSPDGRLIAPRHPLERKRSWREMGPVGFYGRGVRFGDSTVIFEVDRNGQPGYLLKSPEANLSRVRLPWPKAVVLTLFEDATVTQDGIAITGKQDSENLKFYWFPHESTDAPTILNIGTTVRIYDFPVASNLAFAGGRFWVAYMKSEKETGTKLRLWSWKPGEKEARDEALDSPGFWNSHLSLAAVGDRLCLAYHYVNEEREYEDAARIVTVFREAK
ncbi:MAG TPA: hypothetical protein VGE67_03590 [Haloferula sp.]